VRTEGRDRINLPAEYTGVIITSSKTRNLTAKIVEFTHRRSPDFVFVFWIFKISSSSFELSCWSIPRGWKWDFLISPCTAFKYCHNTRNTRTGYIAVDSVMGLAYNICNSEPTIRLNKSPITTCIDEGNHKIISDVLSVTMSITEEPCSSYAAILQCPLVSVSSR